MSARAVLAPLLLAALIAAAYGASVGNDFVHDDSLFMTDPRVQSAAALPRLLREPRWGFENPVPGRVHQYYRPFEPLPYAAAHLLDAGRPRAAHLVNLALHLTNTLLLLLVLRRWIGATPACLVAAAVFAVYPAFSEAVLWPAAAGGLGAFASTWAIFLVAVGPPARWWRAAASAALFITALFFKETGAMAPGYVFAGWWLLAPRRPALPRLAFAAAAFGVPLALYAWLRAAALGSALPRLDYLPFTWGEIALNGLALLPTFARSLLCPFDLRFHHDFTPVRGIADPAVLLGAAVLLAGLALFVLLRRRAPVAGFGVAAALIAALPYLVLHKPGDNVFAERYLYDLAPGAALAVAAAAGALARRLSPAGRRGCAAASAAAVLVFVATDRARSGEWRDEITLFTRTIAQSQRAEIIRVNLGVRLLRLGRVDEAIAVLEELRRIDPHYRGGLENLALCYHAAGRLDDAVGALEAALVDRPGTPTSLLNLAYFYDEQGRRFDAVTTYFRAIAADPNPVAAWNNLAVIALEEGQTANARRAARAVRALDPNDAAAAALLRRVDRTSARAADTAATDRRCAAARALIDAQRIPLAIAQLRAAAWLDEASPLPHQYLANVFVMTGRMRAALRQQREALRRAPENPLYRRNLRALRQQLAAEKPRRKRAAAGAAARD